MPLRESVSVRVLLVSRHIQTIETLCHFLQRQAMHVEICCDRESALRKLCHAKFEGVFVDFNDKEEALDLLEKLRQLTSHRGAVACAIVNRDAEKTAAFQAGANFLLERPLSARSVVQTLTAAYPLMVRERRRYFRCPVQTPTFVSSGPGVKVVATSANISESGIAIDSPTPVQVGQKLQLGLRLPSNPELLKVSGEVCWTNAAGRAGIRFRPTASMAEELRSWLSERMEELISATDSAQYAGIVKRKEPPRDSR
jgi:CheY-like chemotaxis protein